ncbi:MAG TPA: TolC family protein [Terracidiphilus sp.]|nr:TolC family protein [Terracidiphilus sp.]
MSMQPPFRRKTPLAILSCLALCGCATYKPRPLPLAPDLATTPQMTIPAAQLQVPGLAPHVISPQGLDVTDVMTLAVLNNPDLKAARLQQNVASAQILQAGLLPDPQFSASFATSPLNYGGVLSLSQDIQAIFTRGAARAAAKASASQVHLNILWQEIQVAEKARELFIQAQSDDRLLEILQSNRSLLSENYLRAKNAMERGDETSTAVAADLTLLTNAEATLRQLQIEINLTRHGLNALLGLSPEVTLHLIGQPQLHPLAPTAFDDALSALPRRRVDLLALQAGYQSQEENLRRAVLAQFPSLSAGVDLERDPVEGVNAVGPEVTLTLPLFNRNRGQIAIQRATRDLLRQQFQAQLDAAVSQADQVWKAAEIMSSQLRQLDAELPALRDTATAAEQNLRQNNLDAGLYVTAQSNLLANQSEEIRLQASLENAQSALSTLLGLPFGAQ